MVTDKLFEMVNPNQTRKIVSLAIETNKGAVLSFYDGKIAQLFPGFRSPKNVPKPHALARVIEDVRIYPVLAARVLEVWYKANDSLRELVEASLKARHYEVRKPTFRSVQFRWKNLRAEDTVVIENRTFFAPAGSYIPGVDPFEGTFMALLLGWFVTDEDEENDLGDLEHSVGSKGLEPPDDEPVVQQAPAHDLSSISPEVSEGSISASSHELDFSAKISAFRGSVESKILQARERLDAFGEFEIESLDAVLRQLTLLRAEFEDLCTQAASWSDQIKSPEVRSLRQLEDLVKAIEAESERTQDAERERSVVLQVLVDILNIAHTGSSKLSPLVSCQDRARKLMQLLGPVTKVGSIPELRQLLTGEHPFNHLLRLIRETDELSDDECLALEASVGQELGKTIALAALRRKLCIDVSPVPLQEQDTSVNETPGSVPIAGNARTDLRETEDVRMSATQRQSESGDRGNRDLDLSGEKVENQKAHSRKRQKRRSEDRDGNKTVVVAQGASRVPAPSEAQDSDALKSRSSSDDSVPYGMGGDVPATAIARQLLEKDIHYDPVTCRALIWRLLFEGRSSIAFHLTKCFELESRRVDGLPPSWLIRALALKRFVHRDVGEIAALLKEDFSSFSEECFRPSDAEYNHAMRFLLLASALRPALLAPGTGAGGILQSLRLKEGLSGLYRYSQTVADYGNRSGGLDPVAITRLRDRVAREAADKTLMSNVDLWLKHAMHLGIIYAPARSIWRQWISPNGLIHSFLHPIRSGDSHAIDFVRKESGRLLDETQFRHEFESTNRELAGRRAVEVVGKAMMQIRQHTQEAIQLAQQWVTLQENQPNQANRYFQDQANQLRQDLSGLQSQVMEEVRQFSIENSSVMIGAGATYCSSALQEIDELFNPTNTFGVSEPPSKYILNADLLKVQGLSLDDRWDYEGKGQPGVTQALLKLVIDSQLDWEYVAQLHQETRNHEMTQYIVEYLQFIGADASLLDRLRRTREKHLRECREALRRDAESTVKEVEHAVQFGLITDQERSVMIGTIEGISQLMPEILDFMPHTQNLAGIRDSISQRQQVEVTRLRESLRQSEGDMPEPVRDRITSVLDKGDVLSANEYLHLYREGASLPAEKSDDSTLEELPRTLESIREYLDKTMIAQVLKDIRKRRDVCGLQFALLSQDQADESSDMMNAWFEMKQNQRFDDGDFEVVLNALGFQLVKTKITKADRRVRVDVTTGVLQDRSRCPIPFFGSQASGQYRVFCIWDKAISEEDLLHELGDTQHGPPVIVFHFGRPGIQWRRNFAYLSRNRRQSILVLDDCLMFSLCAERGSRLPVLFARALPFSHAEPFTMTSSYVPAEMFYGRRTERSAISDPMGSCFIYGGRQLGKTALLRDVARHFHLPSEGRIGLWLDLKAGGIGFDRTIDDFWSILVNELKPYDVLPLSTQSSIGPSKLLEHIHSWLAADKNRRILLLLDEADRFLDVDSQPSNDRSSEPSGFSRVARLKGLMDKTDRRFKVVFAGLHNVQRTTRLENHPLAHYGEALCIGPLLENGEWREARSLIERPLLALGYRFESPDLVTRILSQTNYYPSLIQLYCSQLLRHLLRFPFDIKASPPYVITARHLEEAYKNEELRKAVRDRLIWTLDLDPRYRVIAFAIAMYSTGPTELKNGFTVPWIRNESLIWWEVGFTEITSEDGFRILLDEMVGLGILRVVDHGKYVLRNPNLLTLMGSPEEIASTLESCHSQERPLGYEAASFRAGDPKDKSRVCPLTAQQESQLRKQSNGVSIVFGCQAAGLDEIESFLFRPPHEHRLITCTEISERRTFAKFLSELDPKRDEGTTIVLVSARCPWGESWIDDARTYVSKLQSKRSFLRIAFVADPATTWRLLEDGYNIFDTLTAKGVASVSLSPWHDSALRRWLDDLTYPSDPEARKKISGVTGNWPVLQAVFREYSQSDIHHWPKYLDKLRSELQGDAIPVRWWNAFGLANDELRGVLLNLIWLDEPVRTEDLIAVVDTYPPHVIRRALRCADLISLIRPAGNDSWRVDPVVSQLIRPR
jgi:hypothetical protein